MYIMFPISFMWYFGTNLENRFSVPGFWPEQETLNKIPYESREQVLLLEQLKKTRLERRRKRLERELGKEALEEIEAEAAREEAAAQGQAEG